jgi:hydrogenase maturation protease
MAVIIIGIGNEYRSDDRAGLLVLRTLKTEEIAGVVYLENDGDGAAMLASWSPDSQVILIDTVSSGAPVGTIHCIDALKEPLPAHFSFPSTHLFSVAQALRIAYPLNQLPVSLVIYGIEGQHFELGTTLSLQIEETIQKTVLLISEEVAGLQKKRRLH